MSSLLHDLQYAFRTLRRTPGFAAVAILTLALGIGATSALFSVVHGVLLRSLPFEKPDRLVQIQTIDRAGEGGLSPPNFMALREQSRAFSDIALYGQIRETLTGIGEAQDLSAVEVSAGFFEVLGVRPALGRGFRPEENQPGDDRVVVLSHGLWQRLFGGDPEVLHRTVMLGGDPRTVVGVMPPGFDFPGEYELWVPIRYHERFAADHAENRRSRWRDAIGRLHPGVTREEAEADLRTIAQRLETAFPEENAGVRFTTVPLLEQAVGGIRTPLLVLFGAVGLVLLIACANVAGLLLARAASRQGEMAVRAALGAGRGRLVRQLLSESVLLAALGGLAGLFLAWLAVEALVAARPEGLPRLDEIRLDGTVVAFTFGVTLLTGLLAGVIPAVRATHRALAGALREAGRGAMGSRSGTRARSGLVVGELALAVILLAGAGLLLRSLLAVLSVDPGFRTEQVLTFRVHPPAASYEAGEAVRDYYDRLSEHLAGLPGVEATGAASWLPIRGGTPTWRVEIEGLPAPGEEREIRTRFVTPGYFQSLGIPLHRGRDFTRQDRGEVPVVVINEAAARRYFPAEDPLGKRVQSLTDERVGGEVVGVVGNARQGALHEEPQPEMYVPHAQAPRRLMDVVVRVAGDPLAVASAIRHEVHALDPNVPLREFRTMEQIVSDSVARPRFLATLLTLFAGVALVMAATGIFGLLSFAVAQRTREIGIRIALGARRGEVVGMIVRRGLLLTAAGLGIGVLGAIMLTRLLRSVLYGISPNDPITFITVVLILGGTALLASFVPARRATRVDPMIALRSE